MKMSRHLLLSGALLVGALGASTAHSQAGRPALPHLEPQLQKTYGVPLKNVTPHRVAWRLDPKSQPSPAEIGQPWTAETTGRDKDQSVPFTFPAGIESIIALDEKKTLLVTGTEVGVQELRKVVDALDQPLRSVEIEAHIIAMTPEEIEAFGLDFSTAKSTQPHNPVSGNLVTQQARVKSQGDLLALLAERPQIGPRAEVKVPHLQVLNNASASLDVVHARPISLQNEDLVEEFFPNRAPRTPLERRTALSIRLLPIIHNDNSLTLQTGLSSQVQNSSKRTADDVVQGRPSVLSGATTIKEGETIAIRGFAPAFTATFLDNITVPPAQTLYVSTSSDILLFPRHNRAAELIVFLTPRVVRQALPLTP